MQGIYNICILAAIILTYYSYKFDRQVNLKIMAFVILVFRNTIRVFDFENSQRYNKQGDSYSYELEVENDDGSMIALNEDFVLTSSLQTTFCFVLCTIGMLHFKFSRALWFLIQFVIFGIFWGPVYSVGKKFDIWVVPAYFFTTGFYILSIYYI